jgi:soluble lytic murein transglycosylase-like protein
MNLQLAGRVSGAAIALLLGAPRAHAEIVILSSGRTLSAKSHRVEGDSIVLQMRTGGEITCNKSLIDTIVPDEVPYPEPQPAAEEAPVDGPAEVPAGAPLAMGPYEEIITATAETHGVDPMLVRALIRVESGDQPTARSNKGAMGLMQLMPSTARLYRVRNPYDPKANIAAGVKHLKSLLNRYATVDLALAAYNAGEGAVKKFNGIPPYRETRDYVSRILALAGLR